VSQKFVSTESDEAPGRQGARSARYLVDMQATSNADGRDASSLECHEISGIPL